MYFWDHLSRKTLLGSLVFLSFPLADPTCRLLFNRTSLCGHEGGVAGRQEWVQEVRRGRSSPCSHTTVSCCWPGLGWAGGGCPHPLLPDVFSASISPRHTLLLGLWSHSPGHTWVWGVLCLCCCSWRCREGTKPPWAKALTWNSHFPGRRHEATRGQVLPAVKTGNFCSPALVQSACRCYKVPGLFGKNVFFMHVAYSSGTLRIFLSL